ncbi:hypothetical protein [Brevibacterium marinum]|uniref:Uncharacterized protein n=1 Tax=Brevibacterium marinum TaxID=418643 RepID=A0A846S101_9MICO|nr:hypothetical protein [Brevibacterium marinum]NJC56748.1 hypothetical protein [Brevibacterium marinum]
MSRRAATLGSDAKNEMFLGKVLSADSGHKVHVLFGAILDAVIDDGELRSPDVMNRFAQHFGNV